MHKQHASQWTASELCLSAILEGLIPKYQGHNLLILRPYSLETCQKLHSKAFKDKLNRLGGSHSSLLNTSGAM